MALVTWTLKGNVPQQAVRGARYLTGRVVMSKASAFPTSGIEKYFRTKRADRVDVDLASGLTMTFSGSDTALNGWIIPWGTITDGASGLGKAAPAAILSGTFVAFGL